MSIINSLPAFVDQTRDQLIKASILGAKSAKKFTLQTGVKTQSAINLLSTDVVFQSGTACGWNASGSATVTQRVITAPVVKINMNYCDKTLLSSALQYDVRVAAGQKTLPFEQDFINNVIEEVALKSEKLIWQGDTVSGSGYLALSDGLIKTIKADVPTANLVSVSGSLTSTNIKAAVDGVYALIPAEVLDKAEIFMGYDAIRLYTMALQVLNLYTAVPNVDSADIYYPGSNVKITAVAGLNTTDYIVGLNPEHVFYGTDLSGDEEKFDFWYSMDNQEFRLAIQFTQGVQIAFPSQVAYRKK